MKTRSSKKSREEVPKKLGRNPRKLEDADDDDDDDDDDDEEEEEEEEDDGSSDDNDDDDDDVSRDVGRSPMNSPENTSYSSPSKKKKPSSKKEKEFISSKDLQEQ